ncbi:MAG: hypothetical protein NTV03_00355 [Candidatus Nomurabacteria bacterium]|nr:hypothetical protein [Candidatus Nomurabacteria bacterium]
MQDSSYKSGFVVQGWGLVRDFCNMFFIFIMLYVAIGTILSLHSMKTKETIVNIVIIGIFINFSLFATQLIIDASNITARVFYNSNAIKITEKGANGVAKLTPGLDIGADGVIPLSAALVNKVNPQNLILSATKINSIPNNSGVPGVDNPGLGVIQFILVIIMASAVNIVGFTVFLTIAFLFIARVVGLWLAMIIAPLAFFTYILPEMAGTKMIGWKNWWPETIKLAFLAPVFIFFMYIVLKFLQADLITDIAGKSMLGDGLGYFVAILVPFAFIMLFMIKAKKIAVDMSGEFGEMAVKAGSAIGGMALGGAVGAGAFAMRGTIGALGDKVANNDWLKTHGGRLGNLARDAGKWTASKSFDARNTKLGGDAMKGMGVDAGKAKEGGYAKHKAEITEKRRARAESKKLGNNTKEVQALHKAEEDEANLKNTAKNDTDRIDGTLLAKKRVEGSLFQALQSANTKLAKAEKEVETLNNDPSATQAQKDAAMANVEKEASSQREAQDAFDENARIIKDNEAERKELNSGTGRHADKTADGKVNKLAYDEIEKSVADTKQALEQLKLNSPNDTVAINLAEKKAEYAEKLFKETDAKLGKNADGSRDFSATTKIKNALGEEEEVVKSLDGLALKIKPHLHHHVEEINAERLNEYAETLRGRYFNKEANDVAAHEAIMRSEIKKH